jgi:hypothetical protein
MSDNKGFANALLIMLNDEWEGVAQGNEDAPRPSLENTQSKEITTDQKRPSICNCISKDLMQTIDEVTPCKEEIFHKFNYSNNYSTDTSDEMLPRYIKKGWVCELCMNFNYESIKYLHS